MKRTKLRALSWSLVALLLSTSQVVAREIFELRTPGKVTLNYEPFSGLPASHTFNLRLKKNNRGSTEGGSREPYSIRIKPSDSGLFEARRGNFVLPVSLLSVGARDLRKVGNEYYQPLLVGTLNEDNMDLEYEVNIRESIFAKPGIYTLPLDIEVIDSNTNQRLGKSLATTLRVVVRPKLQTNIAGTRANYEDGSTFAVVDFDKLESGESERVFIQVRGNSMARLEIQSDNQGRMVHQSIPGLSVNYAVKIDGKHSELTSPLVLSKAVAQDLQGSAYPMEIIVGDVTQSYAGNYHDVITISVSPQ